jgi:hypothetical protein
MEWQSIVFSDRRLYHSIAFVPGGQMISMPPLPGVNPPPPGVNGPNRQKTLERLHFQVFLGRLPRKTRPMKTFFLGYPGAMGGANTESWHTAKVWRQSGIDVKY